MTRPNEQIRHDVLSAIDKFIEQPDVMGLFHLTSSLRDRHNYHCIAQIIREEGGPHEERYQYCDYCILKNSFRGDRVCGVVHGGQQPTDDDLAAILVAMVRFKCMVELIEEGEDVGKLR